MVDGCRLRTRRSMWFFEVDRVFYTAILSPFCADFALTMKAHNMGGLSYRGVPDGLTGVVP